MNVKFRRNDDNSVSVLVVLVDTTEIELERFEPTEFIDELAKLSSLPYTQAYIAIEKALLK